MARFKGQDLYVNDNDQIYFGDNAEAALWYADNQLQLDSTLSGVAATEPYHIPRLDQIVPTVSGALDFVDLKGTPSTYPTPVTLSGGGYVQYVLQLNSTGDGIEFATVSGNSYDPQQNIPFYYDEVRGKWLSYTRAIIPYGKSGQADDLYLGVAGVATNAGYYIHQDACITGIYCRSDGGDTSKQFIIYTSVSGTGTETQQGSFSYSGSTLYVNKDTNIDIDGQNLVRVYVSSAGQNVADTICQLELAWRSTTL